MRILIGALATLTLAAAEPAPVAPVSPAVVQEVTPAEPVWLRDMRAHLLPGDAAETALAAGKLTALYITWPGEETIDGLYMRDRSPLPLITLRERHPADLQFVFLSADSNRLDQVVHLTRHKFHAPAVACDSPYSRGLMQGLGLVDGTAFPLVIILDHAGNVITRNGWDLLHLVDAPLGTLAGDPTDAARWQRIVAGWKEHLLQVRHGHRTDLVARFGTLPGWQVFDRWLQERSDAPFRDFGARVGVSGNWDDLLGLVTIVAFAYELDRHKLDAFDALTVCAREAGLHTKDQRVLRDTMRFWSSDDRPGDGWAWIYAIQVMASNLTIHADPELRSFFWKALPSRDWYQALTDLEPLLIAGDVQAYAHVRKELVGYPQLADTVRKVLVTALAAKQPLAIALDQELAKIAPAP